MALDMSAEQREAGKANFQQVSGELTRRGFMKSMLAAGAVIPVSAAAYFGYESIHGRPVKAALIGGGDEGGVLVGEHNPEYLEFVAVCDIRPFNMKRIFDGDPKTPLRKGFKKVYGSDANNIRKYTDYREMLQKEKDIEAVVIALPLHLHAPVAIDCMRAGKHVLCEKLMARTVSQCKEMIKVAKETGRILSIGHQRHYSMLYAHATEVMNAGVLGDVKAIRALWHRNFSWPWSPDPREPEVAMGVVQPHFRDGWFPPIFKMDFDALNDPQKLKQYGFDNLEQLVRWRLYNRTGGGLMAELGSHQLDASSIFLGKVHPLAVSGVGTHSFFGYPGDKTNRNNRGIDDHVFVTFEFPGANHPQGKNHGNDPHDVVVVSYSSISTNGFEQYGECVMGTRGTMIVEGEQSVMLYKEREPGKKGQGPPRSTAVTVSTVGADKPALEAASTWGPATPTSAVAAGQGGSAAVPGVISRGYREEMEDFAYCIRLLGGKKFDYGARDKDGKYQQRLPRCHGEVAMADAILALTSNLAMKHHSRIEFKSEWFDADQTGPDKVPDAEIDPEKITD